MSTAPWLPWLVLAACCLFPLVSWVSWQIGRINVPVFMAAVQKLLLAGNAERVLLLCRAVPASAPVPRLVAMAIELRDQIAPPGTYRAAQGFGQSFEDRLRAALSAPLAAERARIAAGRWWLLPGFVAPVALVLLGDRWHGDAQVRLALAAGAALVALSGWRLRARALREIDGLPAQLAPLLEPPPRAP